MSGVKAAREAAREEERLIAEAMERAAAEKAAEGSGLGGMAAGLVRRMGDVFTFGKATTAASAASAEGTAGAAAAGDEVGGGAGDGLGRSGGEVEAQGAGGAADAEAEKQARNRELLRAKLKEKQERLRNVDLQALVILSNASCLRTPCLDVGPWGDLALREDAWCSMGCSPLGRTAYHSLQACRLSTVSRTRPGRCWAKGRRSRARRRPPSARRSRMRCSALSVTDRNLTEI